MHVALSIADFSSSCSSLILLNWTANKGVDEGFIQDTSCHTFLDSGQVYGDNFPRGQKLFNMEQSTCETNLVTVSSDCMCYNSWRINTSHLNWKPLSPGHDKQNKS